MKMKTKLIKTTVRMIKQEKSAGAVSLREVARRSGCSAPNIYNYFSSLSELLNEAMQFIIADFMQYMNKTMEHTNDQELIFERATAAYVSYALDNEGWFYFFHFEHIDINVSQDTEQQGHNTGQHMARLVQKSSGMNMDLDKARQISSLIRLYILGEISQVFSGREIVNDKEKFKHRVTKNAQLLFDKLKQESISVSKKGES